MYRFRQFRLLVWKNFLLQIRRPIGTIFEILLPVFFVAILILARVALKTKDKCFVNFEPSLANNNKPGTFQQSVKSRANEQNKNIRQRELKSLNVSNALIAHYPSTPATNALMEKVGKLMNISVATRKWTTKKEMENHVSEMESKYYGAVEFLGNEKAYNHSTLPKDLKYAIRLPAQRWLNDRTYPFFREREPRSSEESLYASRFIFLQYALDASIVQTVKGSSLPYKFILEQFPYPKYRDDSFNSVVAGFLPLLFTFAFIYTAMMIVKELVHEKQCRLKESMKIMGLSNWIHWLAWFTKSFLFLLISVCLITALIKAAKIMENSDGSVVFVFFLLYAMTSIIFCFCMSVFFHNAVLSMLLSGAIWFITYVPFAVVSNENTYDGLSSSSKYGICLLVNSCVGIGSKVFSKYEERGVGVQWSNIALSPSADDNFTMAQVFLMFIVQMIFYGIIAWYVEAVIPGEYGIPEKPWFFLTKSYWFGISTSKVDDSQELAPSMNLHVKSADYEEEPTDLEIGVSICNLKKVFRSSLGEKVAVDDLSFNMFKGQITSLLGHNGAGKTTTMSILTGLFTPSSGTAYVNGYSILTDMDRIRESLGLCPQHNVLFDKLTVREHLKFFINLKGKFGVEANEEIERMINDIQLADKAHWQSRYLSGGMKRKLSCAIALIGGSEIVFLDEPTSGMDPYARRATWDLLLKYKAGRTIILTTHFMDEADFLGERIAIMADGQLRCCGSSLFLKSRYGVGYRLTLVKAAECNVTDTASLVYNHVADAFQVSDVGAELAFVLPSQSSTGFEKLFQTLEQEKDELGISSFGVSVTTLEDVFIKVGEGLEQTVDNQRKENKSKSFETLVDPSLKLDHSELLTGVSLKIHQFKAMFMKRFLHSKRNKSAVLTQLFLPLLMTILGLTIAKVVEPIKDEPSRKLSLAKLSVDNKDTKSLFANFYPSKTISFQDAKSFLEKYQKNKARNINDDLRRMRQLNSGNNIFVNNMNKSASPDNCCEMEYLIINEVCRDQFIDKTATCVPKGYQQCENDCWKFRNSKQSLCPRDLENTNTKSWKTYFEQFVLENSDPNKYFFETVAGFMVHQQSNDSEPTYIAWYSNEGLHTIADTLNVMSNLIIRNISDKYNITAYNHPLPYNTEGKADNVNNDFSSLLLAIFINFGMSFLVASFITFLIYERESKAKHIQFISGVDVLSFWSATYLWDMINYMIPATVIIFIIAAFGINAYSDVETLGSIYFLLILQGLAAIPFVYCLSYIFKTPLVGYALTVLVLAFLSLGLLIAVFILNASNEAGVADTISSIAKILPTYSFSSSFLEINLNYGFKKQCTESTQAATSCKMKGVKYADHTLNWESHGVGKHCLYLFLESIVYFILCLLLQVKFFLSSRRQDKLTNVNSDGTPEDSDVEAEKIRINSLPEERLKQEAIVLKNLTKVYPGAVRTAVDDLCLGVTKGNCFGLLGINGAGKTTTFGMLTGEFPISAGTAYLHGYNIQTELRQVQQRIGYCPQFDALIGNLTGREMLKMYAHLRGIPYERMEDLVEHTIESLNLEKWADKMCGTYSGGNKRKLSTAIALVGNPPIVFLDEPTTGMDPGARRFLWNYLTTVIREGRSIVLTSHSMEECEALCTQLAIMVNGKFKCLGGIQHLKSKFGRGYTLMLKVAAPEMNDISYENRQYFDQRHEEVSGGCSNPMFFNENMTLLDGYVERAKIFVQETFPGAILEESRQGMLTYQIVSESMQWSYVFGALEGSKQQLGIIDYSVSQTTLEQVFLNFAKHQFSEERTLLNRKKLCCF
ncbi:phospholipid-transporting ATPase ABCA3-like [Xenia sp. Carnegie-2017]|uniref:phospholipid-transporting ATPase ABCA3-like n=1 Tax=Xenia sp. Carnegie-2017 TaxID=2897299 RepID=UPI001F04A94C|nr:phospholipid-transporting ATPase ABCA3-like [Xenia sp. Carnegie-2017]